MKKTIVTVVIVVLAAIAATTLYYKHESDNAMKQASLQNGSQPKPQYAAAGQLTSSFPKALEIGKGATTTSSYSIGYTNSNQSTAVYDTTDSISSVYAQYLAYFKTNKYEVLNKSESAKMDVIYAISGGNNPGDISVLITPDGAKTKVTASYLKK